MSVRIVYQDIAAGADQDAVVTAPGAADFTGPALLPSGGSRAAIATLEPFSWVPDGRFSHPLEITFSFGSRYTAPGLFLTFDPAAGDWCSHVTAAWYRIVLHLHATSRPFRYAKLARVMFGVSPATQKLCSLPHKTRWWAVRSVASSLWSVG